MQSRTTVRDHRCRLTRLPAALLSLSVLLFIGLAVPAQAVAPPVPANPAARIYLSFAPDHEQTTPVDGSVAPLSPFTFYVLAEGSVRLSAWEARIAFSPEVIIKRRALPGARNIDVSLVEDNWIVGLGACTELTTDRPLVLARYEGVLLSSGPEAAISIRPAQPSSVPQSTPAWADCSGIKSHVHPFDGGRSVLRLDGGKDGVTSARSGPSALFGASPNPFNPATKIHFRLASSENAKLKIYNLAGRLVRTFDLGAMSAGEHDVVWNGLDDAGRGVASAVYLVRLEAADQKDTLRIVLLK